MGIWLLGYTKRVPLLSYYGSSGWHAHEMLFGYTAAVVAGFLLTAVHNWTGLEAVRGIPLASLALLWVIGRVLPLLPSIPPALVASVDLSFLPALAIVLAVPLLRAENSSNLLVLVPLGMLTVANALVHSEWLGYAMDTARLGIVLAVYSLVLLITIIAGRVIPFFIQRRFPDIKIESRPFIENLSMITVIVLALADLFAPSDKAVVLCAMLAAVVHAWRLRAWLVRAALSEPLLWVLLAGYAWLVVGFGLLAVAYSGFIAIMLAFHALMVGGIGVLTLGMMARVSLGHTGRPLQASRLAVLAFVLMNIAALVRIFGPMFTVRYEQAMISAAGALWIISFMLFLAIYAPILIQARADVRAG